MDPKPIVQPELDARLFVQLAPLLAHSLQTVYRGVRCLWQAGAGVLEEDGRTRADSQRRRRGLSTQEVWLHRAAVESSQEIGSGNIARNRPRLEHFSLNPAGGPHRAHDQVC